MTALLRLAWRSLRDRFSTAVLTIVAVAVAVALFVGVEKVRTGVKENFTSTLSGTHLIVGARTGQVNLLLAAVFRIGNASANVTWATYQDIAARPDVEWTIPLSLGDNHRGYRVLGTREAYFEHYRYARGRSLEFAEGVQFDGLYDAVIGAQVARELGYGIGSELVLTHGLGAGGITDHEDRPFRVVGILKPTGTPVDRTIHVSLEAITAIHVGWETGTRNPLADTIPEEMFAQFDLTPKDITAILVGLKSQKTLLRTQRDINTYNREALVAVIPSQGFGELWTITGIAETALQAVSAFVVVVGLVTILVSILTSLNERRREMAILRAVGAGPGHVFALMLLEAALLALIGGVLGVVLVYGGLALLGPWVTQTYGVVIAAGWPGVFDAKVVGAVVLAALVMGLWPAARAFSRSVADGLTVKV